MYYIDTSVIAAYYCPEPLSEKVESFLAAHKRPTISTLTEIELFSAVSRKIREGNLNHTDGNRIVGKFLAHINGNYYVNIPVGIGHYRLARDWIGLFNTPLKSLDALHLAIASSEELTLVTADQGLLKSAELLGLDAILLE
ncbi:MAG: VapC toxin family PIN domain ribonuclease [Syntrophus sp. (in: bacteria)]|nr:VapC toxin family PIN domain ribonuclease [Syntrophus sp. (in: bacteria)]MBA4419076.1 VapC toxin family PIN domain ribonuclease [Syntrophus sp. (in: bacteria)]